MVLVVVDLVSTLPAMARAQTPPPGWLGVESPGAPTNDEELVKNAVLTVLIVEMSALREVPVPSGNSFCLGKPRKGVPGETVTVYGNVSVHCAEAPEGARITAASATPARADVPIDRCLLAAARARSLNATHIHHTPRNMSLRMGRLKQIAVAQETKRQGGCSRHGRV